MKPFLLTLLVLICFTTTHAQPKVHFGDYTKYSVQTVTLDSLLAKPYFTVDTRGCKVVSFDVTGIAPGKEPIGPFPSKNNKLTKQQYNYINGMRKLYKLWFHNIKVRCKDGTEVVLADANNPFSAYFFTIK